MPQKKLPNTLYLPKQMGKKKLDDLELDEAILHKGFLVELLGLHPSKMMEMMKDREVWRFNLKQLPFNPNRKEGNEERENFF